MTEYLYVLDLQPVNRVKIGQTTHLAKRLAQHIHAAEQCGTFVARVASFACNGAGFKEVELIRAITNTSSAKLVFGREIFAGIPFWAVANLAEKVAEDSAIAPQLSGQLASDLARVLARAGDVTYMWSETIRHELIAMRPDVYARWSSRALGPRLRELGVDIRQLERADANGRRVNRRGVVLDQARAALIAHAGPAVTARAAAS